MVTIAVTFSQINKWHFSVISVKFGADSDHGSIQLFPIPRWEDWGSGRVADLGLAGLLRARAAPGRSSSFWRILWGYDEGYSLASVKKITEGCKLGQNKVSGSWLPCLLGFLELLCVSKSLTWVTFIHWPGYFFKNMTIPQGPQNLEFPWLAQGVLGTPSLLAENSPRVCPCPCPSAHQSSPSCHVQGPSSHGGEGKRLEDVLVRESLSGFCVLNRQVNRQGLIFIPDSVQIPFPLTVWNVLWCAGPCAMTWLNFEKFFLILII